MFKKLFSVFLPDKYFLLFFSNTVKSFISWVNVCDPSGIYFHICIKQVGVKYDYLHFSDNESKRRWF